MRSPETSVFQNEWSRSENRPGIRAVPQEIQEWIDSQDFVDYSFHVRVEHVDAESPAAHAGLKPGDTVLSLNGVGVRAETFSTQLQAAGGKPQSLEVRDSEGANRTVLVQAVWNERLERWMLGLVYAFESDSFDLLADERDRIPFSIEIGGKTFRCYIEISGSGDTYRRLNRYVMLFEKEGVSMEVDLVSFFSKTGTRVEVEPHYKTAGGYFSNTDTVVLKSITEPTSPHALAHELRHAFQHQTNETPIDRRSNVLYNSVTNEAYHKDDYWNQQLEKGGLILLARSMVIAGLAGDLLVAEDLLRRDIQDLRTLNASSIVFQGLTARDVLRLPTLVIERDAEYGALLALRTLKKETGLDLLSPQPPVEIVRAPEKNAPEQDFEKQSLSEQSLSLRNIEHYMKLIDVNIPCLRNARAKLRKGELYEAEDESLSA